MEYDTSSYCKECLKICCYWYERYYPPQTNSFEELSRYYHKWETEDWDKEALEKYGVKMIYDIRKEHRAACEFLGNDGCIIERNRRPIRCNEYLCAKLKKDYGI